MKIIFLSDIHGITTNLKYIEDLINDNNFDKIIILGDIYSFNGDCISIKNFIESYKDKVICVKGNCDRDVDLKEVDTLIVKDIEHLSIDGLDIYITHGG